MSCHQLRKIEQVPRRGGRKAHKLLQGLRIDETNMDSPWIQICVHVAASRGKAFVRVQIVTYDTPKLVEVAAPKLMDAARWYLGCPELLVRGFDNIITH